MSKSQKMQIGYYLQQLGLNIAKWVIEVEMLKLKREIL